MSTPNLVRRVQSEISDPGLGELCVHADFGPTEFGYVTDASGKRKLIYMDEVGTPDSSRIWQVESKGTSIMTLWVR